MKSICIQIFLMTAVAITTKCQSIDTTLLLDNITISQNRLTFPVLEAVRNIDIITKEDIASLPVFNIPELLQYVGAVDIRRRGVNGVQSDAGIRGGTFNQVQILINGVKMNDPQTGHHMMNLPVALADVERIEIVKGPAARVYGQNAFSGAINIITKQADDKEVSIRAGFSLGSFATIGNDVSISIPTAQYDQTISLSRIGSDGYRYNTDYGINNLYYQGNLNGIGNGLKLNAGFTERKFGANGFYANEAFVDQYEEVTTSYAALTTTFVTDKLAITPRLSWRHNVDHYVFLRDDPSFFMNSHTGNTYNGELHASYSNGLGLTGAGLDISNETLVSNNLGDRSRVIMGFFLEHKFSFLDDRVTVIPGAYANKITDRDLKIYPGIDVAYHIHNGLNVFATANWSDRIPTYTNLYYSSRSEQGNENLLAESATAIEVGVKHNTTWSNITVSLWRRDNKNLIDWAKDSVNQEKWLALNFNQVNMTGLDLTSKFKFANLISEDRGVDLTVDYSYINAKIVDNKEIALSRYALDNLRHQLIAGATAELISDHVYIAAFARAYDRVSLENYTVFDTKLMYRSTSFDAFFAVNNLGDKIYRETNLVPMPGRWYSVGLQFKP